MLAFARSSREGATQEIEGSTFEYSWSVLNAISTTNLTEIDQ